MKQLVLAISLMITAVNSFSQTLYLSVSGNVDFDNSSFTVSEAGEDFPSSVVPESSARINLEYRYWLDSWFYGAYVNWNVQISHDPEPGKWDDALKLYIRRTGNGQRDSWWGTPILTGGGEFKEITESTNDFFSGSYGTINIPISFMLSGASLTMGARDLKTTIVITYSEE